MGITTSYTADDKFCIPIPWRDDGQIHTKLRRDSAIAVKLLASVHKDNLELTGGFLRNDEPAFLAMIALLKSMAKL